MCVMVLNVAQCFLIFDYKSATHFPFTSATHVDIGGEVVKGISEGWRLFFFLIIAFCFVIGKVEPSVIVFELRSCKIFFYWCNAIILNDAISDLCQRDQPAHFLCALWNWALLFVVYLHFFNKNISLKMSKHSKIYFFHTPLFLIGKII